MIDVNGKLDRVWQPKRLTVWKRKKGVALWPSFFKGLCHFELRTGHAKLTYGHL